MRYTARINAHRVRRSTALLLLFTTGVTFFQIHDIRGGLFGYHILSLGAQHLQLIMVLSLCACLILAYGLYRGRRIAYDTVLGLSLLFGFGALLTGPTFGTIIDTIICATLLFMLLNYSAAFDIQPRTRTIIVHALAAFGIGVSIWFVGARVLSVSSFDPMSFTDSLWASLKWLLGTPLDSFTHLTPLSESLLSMALIAWELYALITLFIIILSSHDSPALQDEQAWLRRLLLGRSPKRQSHR